MNEATIEFQEGSTVILHNKTSTIPLTYYSLSLDDLLSLEASKDLLTIKTEQATYFIKK